VERDARKCAALNRSCAHRDPRCSKSASFDSYWYRCYDIRRANTKPFWIMQSIIAYHLTQRRNQIR